MMKCPRLNRPVCLALLAITSLLVLSYFPLSRIRATSSATILPSAGRPLANLTSAQNLKVTYKGSSDAVSALQNGSANPTALAAADFDADGAMDVIAGYATANGGVIVLHRGNPDAYAPKDTTLYQKAMQGKMPATFMPKASVFAVPVSPDLIVTGDFNRDGYKDVLIAARGGAAYLLAGDGNGNLLAPKLVTLSGLVTAMAVSGSGHVAAALDGPNGSRLTILTPSADGLTEGASFTLPSRGDSVEWGNLGGGADVAVGAGSDVMMVYGALSKKPQTETVSVPFQVRALALGDFIWDRDGRTEISILAEDGSIHILQHGTLDTRAVTPADASARRAAAMAKNKQTPNPTALGAWAVAKQLSYAGSAPSGALAASAFSSPRLASSATQDLMVLDAGRNQLNILDTSGTAASSSSAVSFAGTPVAALALPQKIDSSRDVIVLAAGQANPMLLVNAPDHTFNVTTTNDEDDAGACGQSSIVTSGTGGDGVLSLREAVCEANNNGASSSQINLPSGTYSLHISTYGGNGSLGSSGELQVGIQSGNNISIVGSGASSTIIQQTDGVDRIIEVDQVFVGNIPFAISYLTLTGGNCTTGQDCGYGGGATFSGGIAGDTSTFTNIVANNNNASAGGGGALHPESPAVSITNSSFSGNSATGGGGAIYFQGSQAAGGLTITSSTFTNNSDTASSGLAAGGALNAAQATGNSVTVSGSTFTGNKVQGGAEGEGGGIYTGGYEDDYSITVSNSRFVGNSAGSGSGAYIDSDPTSAVLTNNWWGCNAGPGGSGCDTAAANGSATFSPWLVLSISANPTSLESGQTSTLTADLTHNSSNTGGFSVPNGVAVAFGGTLGTDNPTSSTLTSGQASSTYTAGGTSGAGSGTAKVDNQTVSVTINIGTPPTITSASSATFTVGTLGSFTVTTNGSPAPSLSDGGATLPSGVSFLDNGNGTASLSGTPGSAGTFPFTITASNGFSPPATQSFTLTVNKAVTTTSVAVYDAATSSPWAGTEVTGASAYATSTVSPSGGGPAPTGNVTYSFYGNGTCSGTPGKSIVALVSGSVPNSGTFGPLSAGVYSFQASYSGDGNYNNSASSCAPLTVHQASTSISVTGVNPSSEVYGQDGSVTITAVLSWSGSGPAPTGAVIIGGNGPSGYSSTSCGSPSGDTLTCTATYTPTASDTVASYNETASYAGDTNYTGSSSTQTGNFSITLATSSTSVGSSLNPSVVGQSVTFTATIDGQNGQIVLHKGSLASVSTLTQSAKTKSATQRGLNQKAHPLTGVGITGTVSWSANTGCSNSSVSGNPGTSQCTTTTLPQGNDTITASYSGDNNHSGSTGTLAGGQVVNSSVTATSIAVTNVSPASEAYGQDSLVTITAVLSWTGGGTAPTASDVTIGGNGLSGYSATTCGSPSGDSLTCTATYTPSTADTVNSYTETASFSGDSNYSSSSSTQTNNFAITQATSTTSVASNVNPSMLGQAVMFTATIDGQYGSGPDKGLHVTLRGGKTALTVRKRSLAQRQVPTGGTVTWSANTGCSESTVSTLPGTATCTTSTLPLGNNVITATYSGDINHNGSSGTLSGGQQVNGTAPTITSANNTTFALGSFNSFAVTTTGNPTPSLSESGTLPNGVGFTDNLNGTGTLSGTPTQSGTFHIMFTASNGVSPNATQNFTLTVSGASVRVNPTNIAFGTAYLGGAKMKQGVTVTNTGTSSLVVSQATVTPGPNTGPNDFTVSNYCVAKVAPGKSCTIFVIFSPDEIGSLSGTLNIYDNAAGSPQQVTLSGTVINPVASYNPPSLAFSGVKVGNNSTQSVTLTNTGTTALDILSITAAGKDPGDFQVNGGACPSSLAPTDSCMISVTFAPTVKGTRLANITVVDNAKTPKQTVPLSGKGQ